MKMMISWKIKVATEFDQFLEESSVEGNDRMVSRDINTKNSKTCTTLL